MATAQQVTQVTQLYAALFVRAPDATGLGYWVDQMATYGKTFEQVAVDMYNTDPARTYYPLFLTNDEIVTVFYTNTLGRAPDADGLAYWSAQLTSNSVGKIITDMITAVTNWTAGGTDPALDALGTESQGLFNNKVEVGEYFATVLRSDDITLAENALDGVTSDPASVDTVNATNAAAVSGTSTVGDTYVLLTTADDFTGTSGNDTFIAAAGRLGTDDKVDGGAGTDTFCAALGSGHAAPVLSNVEQFNIEFRNAAATADFADITGYTAIAIAGNTNGSLLNLGDASKVTLNAYDDSVTISGDAGANTTANSITITVAGNSSGGFNLSSGFETVNLAINQTGFTTNSGAGLFDLEDAKTLNVSGTGNFTLAASAGFNSAMANLSVISASALNGIATLNFGTGATDVGAATALNVVGGVGNDVFNFSAAFQSTDTLAGGDGTDSLSFIVGAASTYRPNMSGVETVSVDFNAAGTFDGRSAAGITTLNVDVDDTAGTFTRLLNVTAINLRSANDTTDNLSVTYQTGADLDITINLGAATTAFNGLTAGDLTVAGNNGSVTLATVYTGIHDLASATFANATALTVNATAAGQLVLDVLTLATAQSVTFNLANDIDMNSAVLSVATTLNVNAAGTAAHFSADQIVGNKLQTVTFAASGVGASEMEVGALQLAGSALSTISITSDSTADVNFANIYVAGTAVAMNFDVSVSVGADATFSADFNLQESLASAAGASDISFTLSGSGTAYNISLNMQSASGFFGTVTLDASNLGASSHVSAVFTGLAVASAVLDATLGAGNDYLIAGSGNDTINGGDGDDSLLGGAGADSLLGGDGDDTLNGGLGNDYIIAGAGDNTIEIGTGALGSDTIELLASTGADVVFYSGMDQNTTGILGDDTILFARSGDSIRFQFTAGACAGYNGLTAGASLSAIASGFYNCAITHTALYQTAAGDVGIMAMYSNGADTVIEVVVDAGSASTTAVAIQRVILEGVTLGVTSAQFTLTYAATGVMITLL